MEQVYSQCATPLKQSFMQSDEESSIFNPFEHSVVAPRLETPRPQSHQIDQQPTLIDYLMSQENFMPETPPDSLSNSNGSSSQFVGV